MSERAPHYGESPDLLEVRTRLAAAKHERRGPVQRAQAWLHRGRDAEAIHQAFRELFMPDGVLRPAGAVVLDYLAERAGFGAASPDLDHAELCKLEGKRALLLDLLARLKAPTTLTADLEKNR